MFHQSVTQTHIYKVYYYQEQTAQKNKRRVLLSTACCLLSNVYSLLSNVGCKNVKMSDVKM
jgi:hypothetical protein